LLSHNGLLGKLNLRSETSGNVGIRLKGHPYAKTPDQPHHSIFFEMDAANQSLLLILRNTLSHNIFKKKVKDWVLTQQIDRERV